MTQLWGADSGTQTCNAVYRRLQVPVRVVVVVIVVVVVAVVVVLFVVVAVGPSPEHLDVRVLETLGKNKGPPIPSSGGTASRDDDARVRRLVVVVVVLAVFWLPLFRRDCRRRGRSLHLDVRVLDTPGSFRNHSTRVLRFET